LSLKSFPRIVEFVSRLKLPLLILGGGGYNEMATVKAWVAATAAACGAELPDSVPLHDFYTDYGPTFCFQHVSASFFSVAAICLHARYCFSLLFACIFTPLFAFLQDCSDSMTDENLPASLQETITKALAHIARGALKRSQQ
jgi:hypothetical protein